MEGIQDYKHLIKVILKEKPAESEEEKLIEEEKEKKKPKKSEKQIFYIPK